MRHSSSQNGFTLIEMLTVMLIIAILAGLVLGINGLVQTKAARARAEVEIKSLSLSCESYKADNGSYPRSDATDLLDPRTNANSTDYQNASKYLYIALSGDTDADGKLKADEGKSYAADFFKPGVLNTNMVGNAITAVNYIKDPFDNSYGYSTIGAKAEEVFQATLRQSANPSTVTRPTILQGYNPTFDLWSTAGASSAGVATERSAKWVKNW